MAKFGWLIILLIAVISLYCQNTEASGYNILTVNMYNNESVDITIPCGGNDPPYTYTRDGSSVVVENIYEYYTADNQDQSNNGDRYCCYAIGKTTCYKLNITYPPRFQDEILAVIPPSVRLGEPYDIECPLESNPPAQYEWARVQNCGSIKEPLSWPQNTILYNNNKTLRLDGVLPLHYGSYNCSATNAFGSNRFCNWREIDVCNQVENFPPDVLIQNDQPNIAVELYEEVEINCTIRSIGGRGKVEWRHNGGIIKSDNVEVITSEYNRNTCGFISTIIITNFTTANEGVYTCNASQPYSNYSSDNVYIFIDNVTSTDMQNQPQESFIMPLSTGLGGTVLFFVVAVTISVAILIKSRKNILSQRVNTQHYTKPPADQLQFKYDMLPIYAEHDRDFVEKNFLTPLDKHGYLILNHHLNFMPGNAIADNILIAIKESRYILPIITENFLESKYCVYELEQSVLRMIKSKSTCIIPVTADIKLLPECLKSLLTSVTLEDKYIGYSTHVDRIKKHIGSPMYSK